MEQTEDYFAIWRYATDDEIDAVLAVAWEDRRGEAHQAYSALYKGETCCPWGVVSDLHDRYPEEFQPDPREDQIVAMLTRLDRIDRGEAATVREYERLLDEATGEALRFVDSWDAGAFTLDEFRLALLRIKRARAQGAP